MSKPAMKSVEEYLQTVWKIDPQPHTFVKLYRGQSEVMPLLPRLFRPHLKALKVKSIEKQLLSKFKNDSPYLLPSKPGNDWDWLSLGQHFKLPTRLLDWSANPLTALFFAVECVRSITPVVYVYHAQKSQIVTVEERRKHSPFDISKTRIFQPNWHSIRVAMQAGWHTIHHIYGNSGHENFHPLQDMKFHDRRTVEILIDPTSASTIRNQLAEMGIKHGTIFGDLQSVCISIQTSLGVV